MQNAEEVQNAEEAQRVADMAINKAAEMDMDPASPQIMKQVADQLRREANTIEKTIADPDYLDINVRYRRHKASTDQQHRMDQIQRSIRYLAREITKVCPPSRERSLALTHLDSCMFNCSASIVRRENSILP